MTPSWVASATVLASQVMFAIAFVLVAARLIIGPRNADRVVALDVMSFIGVGFVALLAYESGEFILLNAAAIPALIGFLATTALSAFLADKDGGRQ